MNRRKDILKWTMVSLGTIVLVLSIVLCVHAISGQGLIGCQAGTSCNQVLGSRWSFLLGTIPVSAMATGAYLALLLCIFYYDRLEPDMQQFTARIMLVIAGAIIGSAIWFIWLQKHFIHAFCPYCMTAHILGIITSILVIIWCRCQGVSKRILHLGIGLILAAALAAIQLLTTPKTLSERGFVNEQLPVMDAHELPVIGNPDAPHAITLLFDWQCSHCRRTHLMLPDVVSALDDSVSFICCPVALSQECNPYVPYGTDLFAGSCELMRTALALWRIGTNASDSRNVPIFEEYERWFWGTDINEGWTPRTPAEAMRKAEELAGAEKLKAALDDPWIDAYTAQVLELFGRTSTNGKAAVPRFILDGNWLIPDADDAEQLATLIYTWINGQDIEAAALQ